MAEPANSGKAETARKPTVEVIQAPSDGSFDMFKTAKYKRVKFHHKSNPTDTPDVVLGVQGFVLKCQRGVETIVPDFILEAADHATFAKYRIEPGQGRKVAEIIRKFPYEVLGEADYQQFKAAYNAGTRKTREAIAQHGLKVPVEQSVTQDVGSV